jgi:hypothetical protein
MRCPKCGYISFDQVESCGKCGKNISEASAKLSGMVLDVVAPLFLKFDSGADDKDDVNDKTVTLGEETEIPDVGLDFGAEAGSVEFTLNSKATYTQDPDLAMELDGFELEPAVGGALEDSLADAQRSEISLKEPEFGGFDLGDGFDGTLAFGENDEFGLEDEGVLDLDGEEVGPVSKKNEMKPPELDFSDIDLSDLAPPVVADEKSVEFDTHVSSVSESVEPEIEMDFGLFEDEEEVAMTASPATDLKAGEEDFVVEEPVRISPAPAGSGLADLQVEDVELISSPLAAPEKVKAKTTSAVRKTGTALDNFDLDLGDLFSEKKE